ncbi:hypothetical protein [Streptomyces sp. NPDC091217]|uniref:hypothetical protein n=1 Tax=Streptomyces sp. NPDC091217 TaxID=3365975 RepID=UPI00382F3A80
MTEHLRRVARGPVAVLTFDGDEPARLWQRDYAPELRGAEERVTEQLAAGLASGAWDERYGRLRTQPEYHGAARPIVSP